MELIDRKELLEMFNDRSRHIFGLPPEYIEDAKNIETIDPVHAAGGCYCKECEYVIYYTDEKELHCTVASGIGDTTRKENDFCSLGEFREGEIEVDYEY